MLWNAGTRGQSRSSALWGTGNNDDSRSNALWGKGGRGLVTALAAALVLVIPLAASAGANSGSGSGSDPTWVAPGMLTEAGQHPNAKIHVIVTGDPSLLGKVKGFGHLDRDLKLISGVALDMPGASSSS